MKSHEGKPKSTSNQGHIPEIGMLFYNQLNGTGNVAKWFKNLHIYVGQRYGHAQDFIITGQYYEPPQVPVPGADDFDAQNDPHGVKKKLYQKEMTRRADLIAELDASYPKIFNIMMGQYTVDSEERVKQHVDYQQAESDKSPLSLCEIIRATHL